MKFSYFSCYQAHDFAFKNQDP